MHFTLPAAMYRDPAQFERERQEIFARNWSLFTWSARVTEPGAFVTGTSAGFPVFVVRGEDNVLRGFHNLCCHRGAALLSAESGSCGRAIVCPYHSWSYDRAGALLRAPDFGEAIDPASWGLRAIDVAEWRGLVFVRIAQGGASLRDWLGPIDTMAADYPLDSQQHFSSLEREEPVDWKVYGENYLECYHCRAMHPGLCAAMDINQYRIDVHAREQFFHLHAPKREGGLTRGLYFYRFPFLMLNLYDWGSSIATLEPLGAGRMRHINWYFFQDVSPGRAEENARSAAWSAEIVSEDLAILAGVQRNLNAGIYDRGPISPRHEYAVKAFQDMVTSALDGDGLRAAAE